MTRAKAAEVAERLHIDEDAVLDLSQIDEKADPATPESTDRAVLGDIAPNSADSKKSELVGRKTRSKKKAKGRSEPDANVEEEQDEKQSAAPDEEQVEENADEQTQRVEALEATTNETMERLAKLRITSLGNQTPVQTPDASISEENTKMTPLPDMEETTQQEINDSEALDAVQGDTSMTTLVTSGATNELPNISITTQPQVDESEQSEVMEQPIYEEPDSPVATAVPKVIKSLRKDSPTKRSTSNKENVEPLEPLEIEPASVEPVEQQEQREVTVEPVEVVEPAQPAEPVEQTEPTETVQEENVASVTSPAPASAQTSPSPQASTHNVIAAEPTTSPSRPQSSGKSEDQIEALDNLNEAVDKVNESIPDVPSPAKKTSPKPTDAKDKLKKAKPAPVVRMTKAAAARLSMAQGGDKDAGNAAAKARPRPSSMIGRSNTVRQSVAPATARNTSTTASKPSPKPKKETVIPHSKPRPVSLSFPTPPPAARSSKAPTKSSFQLPGEAVAAKLKAAREERMKREAAATTSKATAKPAPEEKKPAFKARPVPSTLKKAPSVRQTAASRAREPNVTGDAASKPSSASSSTTGLKRSNTVATSRPRPPTISATTSKSSAPVQLTVQKRARPSSVHIPASSAAAPRVPSTSASNSSTAPTSRNTSTTSKGKEVYARFSAARNAAENEKREKEDAARKARAAAAERGRVASREWAEKQRVKKMVAMMEGGGAKE